MPAGTLTVDTCWSAAGVSAKLVQSLVPLTRAGMSPVQVTTTFWPALPGTVMLLVAGLEAQLNIASDAPIAKRMKVRTRRGLKRPDLEAGLIRIVCGSFPELGLDRDESVFGTVPPGWMLTFL